MIAVLIKASTPRNPRPHIVQVPAAYHRTQHGPVCPACIGAYRQERALLEDLAETYAAVLEPVALPAETLRIYTRNGKVVATEPLTGAASAPPEVTHDRLGRRAQRR